MIIGIGTDLLDIARVRKILEQPAGGRFLERVLTPRERELAEGKQGAWLNLRQAALQPKKRYRRRSAAASAKSSHFRM